MSPKIDEDRPFSVADIDKKFGSNVGTILGH